jgi:hypothetical protein
LAGRTPFAERAGRGIRGGGDRHRGHGNEPGRARRLRARDHCRRGTAGLFLGFRVISRISRWIAEMLARSAKR